MDDQQSQDDDSLGLPRRNLNFFYTLDAILNAPSLREAAQAARLSQPAISIALQKAREQFGDPLVISRGSHRFTNLANTLRPKIRKLLIEASYILDSNLTFDRRSDDRVIRVSMPEFVEVLFLPAILKLMRLESPNIRIVNLPFDYVPIEAQFEKNLDFAIVPGSLIDENFRYRFLYDDSISVLVSNSIKGFGRKISVEQYRSGSHAELFIKNDILTPKSGPIHDLLEGRHIVVRTSAFASLPQMAVDTDLIVTTSSRYAQECTTTLPLVAHPLPLKADYVDIGVQWQPFRHPDPMIRWFVDLLCRAALPLQRETSEPLK